MDLLLDQLIDRADELRSQAELSQEDQSSEVFSYALLYLRDYFPDRHIRQLCGVAWDLIDKSLVFTQIDEETKALEFEIFEYEEPLPEEAHILIPPNWILMFIEDAVYQLGSILFAAVQVVDFYNNRNKTDKRCMLYESELLLRILETYKHYTLDTAQKASLDAFPEGMQGKDSETLLYTSNPVFIIEA